MKTIIYLHPHFTLPGGAGKFVLETGKLLKKRGYEIIVVSIKADDKIIINYKKYIKFIDIGGSLSSSIWFWLLFPISYFKVARILNRQKDFILFPQVFPANWWGFIYKKFHPKIKLVWMCQEPSAFIHSKRWIEALPSKLKINLAKILNPLLSSIDKSLAPNVDLVFANSNYTRDSARAIYHYAENKIETLYLGVDLSKYRPDKRIQRKNQIITVGRLTKFKEIDKIIEMIKALSNRKIVAKLVIIGEGEEKKNLINLSRELKLSKKIKFTGQISDDDLIHYYQESKILILNSKQEPFGLVAVEAMATGTPVIVNSSGGVAEIVKSGETGFAIKPTNAEILQEKVKILLSNNKLFFSMSKNAAEYARQFSWENTADHLIKSFINL